MAGNLISADLISDLIYKHSGRTSAVDTSIAANTGDGADLTYDESNLWSQDYVAVDDAFEHDGFSTTILNQFSLPATNPHGLTYDGTDIISSDASTNIIYKHTGKTGTVQDSYASGLSSTFGITTDGKDIYAIANGTDDAVHFAGFSSTQLGSFTTASTSPQSITHDGVDFIISDSASDDMDVHDGFSSTVIDNFNSPATWPIGVTWDDLVARLSALKPAITIWWD